MSGRRDRDDASTAEGFASRTSAGGCGSAVPGGSTHERREGDGTGSRLRRALRVGAPAGVLVTALVLAGCAPASEPPAGTGSTTTATEPGPEPTASATPGGSFIPAGEPEVLAEGLDVPWSVVVLDDGTTLVSERETARVLELVDGALREVGTVPGVRAGGEGGLMGLAALEADGARWLYAMHTGADDNRIVRMPLQGEQ